MKGPTIKILGALIIGLSLSGCFAKSSETVISSAFCVVDKKGVEFTLDQPLQRKFNSGSVRIDLEERWQPLPPWTSIQLADGRMAKVTVVLFSEDGRTFTSAILGSSGRMLNVRFEPEIPKKALINKLRIASDIPLTCKRIVWYDFNAE